MRAHAWMDVYTRAHSHPEAANLWLAEAAVEQGRAAFQHRPALPSEDAASRRAARGTRRGSGRWGRGEGEHPKPDPGTPRLSADISWHGHPGTPGHNLLSRCLQNRQRAQEMIGEGGGQHFPTAQRGSGTQYPTAGGAGSHLGHGMAPCSPTPGHPHPPGICCPPAGAGQRCGWACRPAPGSPRFSKPAALQRMEQ